MPFFSHKFNFSASTTTLSSTVSTPSNASTTSLLKQSRPEKDYFTASGTLQSLYGFGGAAPTLPTMAKPSKSTKSKSASEKATTAKTSTRGQEKDFEAAYGALSSMYGFGGAAIAPTPVRSTSK